MQNAKGTFTYTLTNETLVIDTNDGLTRISVYNSSAVDATITGEKTVSGLSSEAVTVSQGETATVVVDEGYVLNGVTIVSPSGCTLQIIAN